MSSRKVTVTTVSMMPRFSNMSKKLYDKNYNVLAHISKHGQLVFKGDEEFVVVGGFRLDEKFRIDEEECLLSDMED